jgi:hypothetical protein
LIIWLKRLMALTPLSMIGLDPVNQITCGGGYSDSGLRWVTVMWWTAPANGI